MLRQEIAGLKSVKYFEILAVFYVVILLITLTVYSKFIIVENLPLIGQILTFINDYLFLNLSLTVPAAVLPFAFTYPICDLVAEVYGSKPAKKLMVYGVLAELCFAAGVLAVINMPGKDVIADDRFFVITHNSILLYAISNIIGTFVGKTTNIYLISKLKIKYYGKAFCSRSLLSTIVGELLLSVVAATISFGQNLTYNQVISVAVTCFIIKLIIAIIMVKPIQWLSATIKYLEGVDVYDSEVNMNPFDMFPDKK